MRYFEVTPPPPLDRFVRCLWVLEGDGGPDFRETIFPDGCPELVFHYRDPFRRLPARGGSTTQHRAAVVGQLREAIVVEPTGSVGLLGVRFHPAGARPLLGAPMAELTGESVDLGDLWGRAGKTAEAEITAAPGGAARLSLVVAALRARAEGVRPSPPTAEAAVEAILRAGGNARIDELSRVLHVSPRHLERVFCAEVGIGPKEFSRIARFRRLLPLLTSERRVDAALRAGYFDQAHMNREFRALTGVAPGRYLDGGLEGLNVFNRT